AKKELVDIVKSRVGYSGSGVGRRGSTWNTVWKKKLMLLIAYVWQAAQSHIATPNEMMGPNMNLQVTWTTSEGSETP
ncbi:hypothetical protein Tco_1308183, partial [Tanacetum coccineum]